MTLLRIIESDVNQQRDDVVLTITRRDTIPMESIISTPHSDSYHQIGRNSSPRLTTYFRFGITWPED